MKKILIATITALLTMVSCSDDNKTLLPDPQIDFIQTQEIVFEGVAQGATETIVFNSPATWTAEVHQTGSWLKAENMHGAAGSAEITLSPRTDNFGITQRQATVQIYIDGYQAYSIMVTQRSAATGDIVVEGNVSEGVMNLQSDDRGTSFSDTIYVTSKSAWTLSVSEESEGILSFDTDKTPQNGAAERTRVIVTADYGKFTGKDFSGKFYIRTQEGTALPIMVNATPVALVYDKSRLTQNETERTSYELVDTVGTGVFQTTFYIDSNVRWQLASAPEWLETSADWSESKEAPSNVRKDGTIQKQRQPVTLNVKADQLSAAGKTATVKVVDVHGNELKSINLVFAGTGSNYISYSLSLPQNDVNGNPWAFEAHQKTVEAEGPYNRRRINAEFYVTTSADYTSIADAPFHLILVDATNGVAHKREVHWASLKMGNPSEQATTTNGMHRKQLVLEASERGDADDRSGLTTQSEIRHAFIYLVPRTVFFSDMWQADGTLKEVYANDLKLLAQHNDPEADYFFGLDGVTDGSTITISPQGETLTYNVAQGSYDKCSVMVELQNGQGEWSPAGNVCRADFREATEQRPATMTLEFSENKAEYNPFTQTYTSAPRHMRIRVMAFISDTEEPRCIFTFYAEQGTTQTPSPTLPRREGGVIRE